MCYVVDWEWVTGCADDGSGGAKRNDRVQRCGWKEGNARAQHRGEVSMGWMKGREPSSQATPREGRVDGREDGGTNGGGGGGGASVAVAEGGVSRSGGGRAVGGPRGGNDGAGGDGGQEGGRGGGVDHELQARERGRVVPPREVGGVRTRGVGHAGPDVQARGGEAHPNSVLCSEVDGAVYGFRPVPVWNWAGKSRANIRDGYGTVILPSVPLKPGR
ncbi:hypothetical protein C8R44DRAFT_911384 [Mycena epipterygia]|nr:hypothetical protein C8R44DRAFT_911384 [Mycena epipterygia]